MTYTAAQQRLVDEEMLRVQRRVGPKRDYEVEAFRWNPVEQLEEGDFVLECWHEAGETKVRAPARIVSKIEPAGRDRSQSMIFVARRLRHEVKTWPELRATLAEHGVSLRRLSDGAREIRSVALRGAIVSAWSIAP